MYLDPIQPKNVSIQGNSVSIEKTEQAKPVVFEAKTEKTDLPEPQFVTQYGKTKLPEGSVLKKEVIVYEKSIQSDINGYKGPDEQYTCGIIALPNGIEVTVVKNSVRKGEISISDDNETIFNEVDYTYLIGTDGDDKITFKGDYTNTFVRYDGYKPIYTMTRINRTINTRKGNDEIKNPGVFPCEHSDGPHVTVNSDENLKVSGEAFLTDFNVNGNLDLTKVTDGVDNRKGAIEKKK